MDFNSLGKRDIFGILLPGIIPVLIGAYALYATLSPFQLPVVDILPQQLLLTVLLFASAYLVGSLLRLFAADAVDEESGKYLLNEWKKDHKGNADEGYELAMREFLKGNDAPEVPPDFDGWLWSSDAFPYSAGYNRLWRIQGFQDLLDFFQKNHKARMWPQSQKAPKNFFGYCKLTVLEGGGTLADEVNTAESTTRFFAGTLMGMRLSTRLLEGAIVFQTLVIIAKVAFAQRAGIDIAGALDWKMQSIYLVLSFLLISALLQMCSQIIKRFRAIRIKEAGIVFHAFYLYATRPYKQEEKKKNEGPDFFFYLKSKK